MDVPDIETLRAIGDLVSSLTVAGLLGIALGGFLKGTWVAGRELKALRSDFADRIAEHVADNARLRAERDIALARVDAMAAAAENALDRVAAAADSHGARR